MSLFSSNTSHRFWEGRSVLVTGHTGFKGTWLSLWLTELGAQVHGVALPPEKAENMFDLIALQERLASHSIVNINDLEAYCAKFHEIDPEIVFHFAAQPLVRTAYYNPIMTLSTNILGTAHILEAVRKAKRPTTVVLATTDKVYENREWVWPYREQDRLGGHEPYAASKSAAEIITEAYRHTYFKSNTGIRIATVRAGNVVGGGDWSDDRLIPDAVRAFTSGRPLQLRYPGATRPWQHVFEPVFGYLDIAMALHSSLNIPSTMNFGPDLKDVMPVNLVSQMFAKLWGDEAIIETLGEDTIHEAKSLALDNSLARYHLKWRPTLSLEAAIAQTVMWYKAYIRGDDMLEVSLKQLLEFENKYYA